VVTFDAERTQSLSLSCGIGDRELDAAAPTLVASAGNHARGGATVTRSRPAFIDSRSARDDPINLGACMSTRRRFLTATTNPPNGWEFCGEGPPEVSAKLDRGAAIRFLFYHEPCGPAYRANSEIGRRSFVRSNSTLN
jgi:hypothetical protein